MSTLIQWTDDSWNPIRAKRDYIQGERVGWHCERVSDGCVNCYAERQNVTAARGGTGLPYTRPSRDKVSVYLDEKVLTQPLHWVKPRRVFVCSMSDLFGEWVSDEMLDRVFAVMALTPHITYQVLTKRPERMREYLSSHDVGLRWMLRVGEFDSDFGFSPEIAVRWTRYNLPNVWFGTSVENQKAADERIPELLAAPVALRFLSMEPLLESLDLRRWLGGPDSEQGRRTLLGSGSRGTDDRFRGTSMAARSQASGSLDRDDEVSSVPPASGGEQGGEDGVFAGASDDQWGEGSRTGAPASLPPLLRTHSRWDGRESSERQQAGQQARESGAGDVFRELRALTPGAAAGQSESVRRAERDGETERRSSVGYPRATGGRGTAEQYRSGLRGELPNDFEDRTRGSLGSIGWLICGGESGSGARPTDIGWIRGVVEQCKAAGVPVFVKQDSGPRAGMQGRIPDELWIKEYPR